MENINTILNWVYNKSEMKNSANFAISSITKKELKNSVTKLEEMIERLPDGIESPKKDILKNIYLLFMQNKDNDFNLLLSLFNKKNTRILIWALDQSFDENTDRILLTNDLKIAVKIIMAKWNDSYILSIWYLLIKNWNKLKKQQRQFTILKKFLYDRAYEYNGNRKNIKNIVSNLHLFLEKDSTDKYADMLFKKKITINNAHVLIEKKQKVLNCEYYSLVVESYFKKIINNDLEIDNIEDFFLFLEIHNNHRTDLIIFSYMINNKKFENYIESVKINSIKRIGDPVKIYKWKSENLSMSQEKNIEKARIKLNLLLNKQLIEVFFENLVQDYRRKHYWLAFIKNIDDIKFCGNRSNYRYLKNMENVSNSVDSRYKITRRNQNTCALVIYSKEFIFVEFSDTGALYIYEKDSFDIDLNSVNSMEDLKKWSKYDFACRNSESFGYVDLRKEGRITHQGDWESRVNIWMKKYYDN